MKHSKLVFLLWLLTACNGGGDNGPAAEVETLLGDTFETAPPASGSVITGACYEDRYAVSEENIIRKLDIIIVPDTSGSIVEERASIAAGFEFFINTLPTEVDFRIGVILGHSGNSTKSSKLYKKASEDLVLDSLLHTKAEIITALTAKMKSPAGDSFSDGGEMGLYSLYHALSGDKLSNIQAQGLLREDAALVVIFVADEQDICAKFPEGVIPVPDPDGGEARSFAKYCVDTQGNYLITPKMVVDRLKEVKGSSPLVVGGVLYNNLATIPISGENELGYGYLDAISLAGGLSVDMANGDYSQGLNNLGKLATVSIKPVNDFNLQVGNVLPSSIEVLVQGEAVAFEYNQQLNQVHLLQERDDFSVAQIKYCERPEVIKESIKVVAGGSHTCAILNSGEIKCWGRNLEGQLGLGHKENIGDDEFASSALALDNGGVRAIDLSAGFKHTCAVFENGEVKCWGDNSFGQLGRGNTIAYGGNNGEDLLSLPAIPLAAAAKKIYSGTYYNCALLANSKIQCWGQNNYGQLGYGHTNTIGDDESLVGLPYVSAGANVIQMNISSISFHTCAALSTGDLRCWGLNNKGQLGYGHTNNIGDNELPSSVSAVPFSEQILQLTTGAFHTCALVGGESIRCFGDNTFGQLGTGLVENIGDDELVTGIGNLHKLGGNNMNMVIAGNRHNCAIDVNNNVYCWGQGDFGQLGHGNTFSIGDDEAIDANNTKVNLVENKISQITAGISHSCGLTKDEGKIICWGSNDFGQLGIGNTSSIGDDENPSQFVELLSLQE